MHKLLAEIIRPIVEGQVKAWQDAHPEGERFRGHLIRGVGKRITHDICSAATVERIKLALGQGSAPVAHGQAEAVSEYGTERPAAASGLSPEQPMDAGALTAVSGGRRGTSPLSGFPLVEGA